MRLPLASCSLLALVGCNKPPEGGAIGITPADATTVDDLVAAFTVDPVDPNGNELQYTWTWTRNSQPEDLSVDTVPADRTARGEVWEVRVEVSDGKEISLDVLTASVTVGNTPPTLETAFGASELPTTEDLVATETSEDADDDPISIAWTWTLDGAAQDDTGPSIPAARTRKGQVWEITAIASDQEASSEPSTSSITIVNSVPSVQTASVSPDSAFTDTELSCIANGWVDADLDPEAYVYAWYVNGTVLSGAVDATLSSDAFSKGDEVACELTPNDSEALGTPVRSDAIPIQNSVPVLDAVSIDPSEARTADDLVAVHAVGIDADGDLLTASYAWSVDGAPAGSKDTLLASAHAKGQEVSVTVTLNDGEVDSEPVTSAALRIANTAPIVTAGSLTPTEVFTDGSLAVSVVTEDADDDAVTTDVVWKVNGASAGGGSTLDGSNFEKNDVVTAEITPNDGQDDGAVFTTASVTVSNTPPTAPTVSLTGTPEVGRSLVCVVDTAATDADGDSLTYTAAWTVNGSAYTSATTTTITGDTVPFSVTKDKEVWVCSVTASDGTDTGTAGTASATIVTWAGDRTFTNCSATGQDGPAQSACDTAYGGSRLDGEVTVASGIQSWTAPQTGTYRIEALGAQGRSADTGRSGGRGARMRGDFSLTAGDKLQIAVGQVGVQNSCNGGGGGGSFVARGSTLLLVAGGGGGTRDSVLQNGCDANTAQQAGSGSGSRDTHGCGLKSWTTISTGGIVSATSWGSGGGAYNRNGASEYDSANGGRSYVNGARGGGTSSYLAHGGFGGGGAGNGGCGGGGGGGYSGGDGGRLAGAGGSYNVGSNQSNSAGARTGAGQVTIDLL